MLSSPKTCREGGCGLLNQRGSGYCEKHAKANSVTEKSTSAINMTP